MKAVILCAGRGLRMHALTKENPKPLLLYKEKTLLEHKLEALPDTIEEVVVVIGYLGHKIKNHFGEKWVDKYGKSKKISYIEQTERLGTAHALFEAKYVLTEPFIVLMGDDLYKKEDLEKLVSQNNWAILVENPKESKDFQKDGRVMTEQDTSFTNFLYTGACFLTPEIFKLTMVPLSGGPEYGLPQTFAKAVSNRPIIIHHATFWKRITSGEDLE